MDIPWRKPAFATPNTNASPILDFVIVELPEQTPVPSVQVHFGNADQVIAGRKSVLRECLLGR